MVRFSQRRALFNRYVTNPLFRPISGYAPAWSVVEHIGRRSGKTFRTPVSVFRTNAADEPGLAILLPYGPDRDWVKNLQVAGRGRVKLAGRTFSVTNPRVVFTVDVIPALRRPWRQLIPRANVEHTLLLDIGSTSETQIRGG